MPALIAALNAVRRRGRRRARAAPAPAPAAPAPSPPPRRPPRPWRRRRCLPPPEAAPRPARAAPRRPRRLPAGDRRRPRPRHGGNAPPQTIRVTVDVLEDLMTLVCELVLTRNQLLQLARNERRQRLRRAAAAPVAHHLRPAGRGDEDPHAADRQCLGQAAAPGARPRRRTGQEDRAGDARRRDRARPPGAGADQGPADPHGAQLRRPRAGDPGRAASPPASRKPAASR